MSSLPISIASTIQSASLNRSPSPTHDLNPSTSASSKQPVRFESPSSPSSQSHSRSRASSSKSEEIPYEVLRPIPRQSTLPPLPDLRFEQSYLASLQGTQSWRGVVWVTVRDQVFFPLVQGTLWTLALSGWRFWNKGARVGGRSVGGRIRKWWWGVNNWEIPREKGGRLGDRELARQVGEYYEGPFGNAGGD